MRPKDDIKDTIHTGKGHRLGEKCGIKPGFQQFKRRLAKFTHYYIQFKEKYFDGAVTKSIR
jgi:hypothetical protein